MIEWQKHPCKVAPSIQGKSVKQYLVTIDGKQQHASRAVWEEAHGPIPEGHLICHHCDNRPCFELLHLFLGTPKDNTQDCIAKGRFHFHPENLTKPHPMPGERNGRAKLKRTDVENILKSEWTSNRLAQFYGVSGVLIGKIRNGHLWKEVPRVI